MNIFFDAKIFINVFFNKNRDRSGFCFVAWNVLQIMRENKDFHITLAYSNEYEGSDKLKKIKKDAFFSQFKFVNAGAGNAEFTIMKNLDMYKKNKNYAKMFYNYLRLARLNIKELIYYRNKNFTNAQIFLSPCHPISRNILSQKHIKKFCILHDTIPVIIPECKSLGFDAIIENLSKDIYYFCVSQSCKDDFLKYFGDKLDANKMFVIYNAPNRQYVPIYDKNEIVKVLKKYGVEHNPNDKYLFSLCGLEPRKNLPFTIACFIKFIKKHNINDLYFYLGGGIHAGFSPVIKKAIDEAGEFNQKIKLLGYIDDEDTNILYSNSLFFTFLSQYEGFGMPPLEAMQAGTPVITSNNSSLPEVVGNAAISLTYNDEEAVIKAFENFYFNEILRKKYIEKGLERAKLFSWEKSVGRMIEIIEEAAKCSV